MSRPPGHPAGRPLSLSQRRSATSPPSASRPAVPEGHGLALFRSVLTGWRWAALPFGVIYLVLLATQFRGILATTNLDADTVSAPVIGELFGSAGPHASVVLGTFGWYASLLFELATKWLPLHRQIWEVAPYAMALAGVALMAWSVWQIAGRWAAGITAVLLICAAPDTLRFLLSMTQHGPDWFCCALLAAFLVLVERRATTLAPLLAVPLAVVVGTIVGVNAASDILVSIAGLGPFAIAALVSFVLARNPGSVRALQLTLVVLVAAGISWAITAAAMSAAGIGPQPGLHTAKLAAIDQIGRNFRLWWQSIAVLGNGDFLGRDPSFSSGLAVLCAALSIAAIALLPRIGWRELRHRPTTKGLPAAPDRLAFVVFWCSSAILLTGGFLLSSLPLDIHADRYLVGLVYAAAALIPVLAAGRQATEAAAVLGTCVFALGGITSMLEGVNTRNTSRFPSTGLAHQIAAVAAAHHLKYGYAGYWDAAPITWATQLRVQISPVSVCDQGARLCPFDLHYISSWYTPHPGAGSFLLVDPAQPLVRGPTPDLGPVTAVYHVGRISMFVYPYDLATKLSPS
jgi:hypothetical protein